MAKPRKDDWPFLYHWAPSNRRGGIVRRGLVPGCWSVDRLWRPPHVCLAPHPGWAWRLSGAMHPEIDRWDLWEVWTGSLHGWEVLGLDKGHHQVEVRVYQRIMKRDVELVATRDQSMRERPRRG